VIDVRWQEARRVLVVRLDNLGDVLVTTPAIHAIKRSLPEAHVTLLSSALGAQAGRLNPDVDDVLVHEAPWMDPWRRLPQDPEREMRAIAGLRDGRFDAAVIFSSFRQSPLPAAYLCYLAGIPLRLAASIDGPGSLLTTRHKRPPGIMHEVELGLDLVGAVGLETDELDLVLRVSGEDLRSAVDILPPRTGPVIVVHAGCTMPARTYPWEMFAQVADLLVERLNAIVVLTGSDGERDLVSAIRERMLYDAIDLAGAAAFPVFCGVVQCADLVITNNTGPMHVAAAVKTPVVALFALTNPPEQWGPWRVPHRQLFHDVPCRICYSRVCPYELECLRYVTPNKVTAAAAELLGEGRRGAHDYERPEPLAVGTGGVIR